MHGRCVCVAGGRRHAWQGAYVVVGVCMGACMTGGVCVWQGAKLICMVLGVYGGWGEGMCGRGVCREYASYWNAYLLRYVGFCNSNSNSVHTGVFHKYPQYKNANLPTSF